jgi:MarR family transcriptional regulator, multiple antibiotic resistance protein MarR
MASNLSRPDRPDHADPAAPVELRALFEDLVRAETRLYNALNDRLRERHGIVTSQFEFLRFVHEHPGARVADLATAFAVGIGAMSKGADRLERQGWIARQPNPADRRSSLLVLTEDGQRLLEAAQESFDERLAELLGLVPDTAGLPAAAQVLAQLRAGLESAGIGLPVG